MVGELGGNFFEFDVVTIDDRGSYINRDRGRAEFFTEDLGDDVRLEMVAIEGGNFLMGDTREQLLSRFPDGIINFFPMKSSTEPQLDTPTSKLINRLDDDF